MIRKVIREAVKTSDLGELVNMLVDFKISYANSKNNPNANISELKESSRYYEPRISLIEKELDKREKLYLKYKKK